MAALTHSPADILAAHLIQLGLGVASSTADWTVRVDKEPSDPDRCITVYNTEGQGDGRSMIDGDSWDEYGFQVRVRGRSSQEAWKKAADIEDLIQSVPQSYNRTVNVDGTAYVLLCCVKVSQPIRVGVDSPQGRRHLVTVNGLIVIKQ